jgi:hypothetical protein
MTILCNIMQALGSWGGRHVPVNRCDAAGSANANIVTIGKVRGPAALVTTDNIGLLAYEPIITT